MKQTKVGDAGEVRSWNYDQQPELTLSWVASSMQWQRSGHVGGELELVGYFSPWRNGLYDDREDRQHIRFYVYWVEGREDNFSYIAWRIPGNRIGDPTAAEGQEPEWFKITVQKRRTGEKVSGTEARWERISPRPPL